MQLSLLLLFLVSILDASITLDTVYGKFTVEDPVIIELIKSPPFQRLKEVNQYGFTPFLKPTETYKRYEHSIGVFLLLREHNRSQIEQIAGLLHDVSHTAFSHVGDYVFGKAPGFFAYQDEIHTWYLHESGLSEILAKYGIDPKDIVPENFPLLKNSLPNLCADRIDYNLQGGYLRGLITKAELAEIWQDLRIENEMWLLTSEKNGRTLAEASLEMTEHLWGGPWESIVNRLGALAINYAIEQQLISREEFHFSKDHLIWEKLHQASDPYLKEILEKMRDANDCFMLTEKGKEDFLIFEKFRGINPLIKKQQKIYKLTELDLEFAQKFSSVKTKMENGWPILWISEKKYL